MNEQHLESHNPIQKCGKNKEEGRWTLVLIQQLLRDLGGWNL